MLALFLAFLAPLGAHAVYWSAQDLPRHWSAADWSSAGIAPAPAAIPEALVQIYAARTGSWKGIFAVHSWIVLKRRGADSYTRYEVVGWGSPVRRNAHAADGRWYSNMPELLFQARGPQAAALIPKIEQVVSRYPYARHGDYRIWPGPNSNSFIAWILASVPEIDVRLPPTAIGKDFPVDGRLLALTPGGTGIRLSAWGYAGLTLGLREGLEINILGLVSGVDFLRPALKLPGFGRIGVRG